MESRHSVAPATWRASAGALPRLSGRSGFWAIALAFLAITAFSATPSSLYGLYGHREHLSSLTITIVFAVYAGGVVVSLLLAGHVSDWYGRRPVLLTALALVVAAALVFLLWRSLAGLVVARVLTGLGLGAAMATATAFIADLDSGAKGRARRSGIVATTANVGGLALGALVAGLLGRYAPHPLTLPFVVLLAALLVAVVLVILSPEGHPAIHPRPRYHPQRLAAPANGRRQFVAASTGAFTAFAVSGLFAGLTATFLAGPLHHPSPALIGLAIFLTFGVGVLVQTTTTRWPSHRLVAAGITPIIAGLCLVVASAWTSPPSLTLFLISGVVAGIGVGAIFRGSTTVVLCASGSDDRAGALASFFIVGYAGISLPVIGVGLALEHLSPRVTLLIFGLAAGLLTLAAAPVLLRPLPDAAERPEPVRHPMTAMCCGFGAEIGHGHSEADLPGGPLTSTNGPAGQRLEAQEATGSTVPTGRPETEERS